MAGNGTKILNDTPEYIDFITPSGPGRLQKQHADPGQINKIYEAAGVPNPMATIATPTVPETAGVQAPQTNPQAITGTVDPMQAERGAPVPQPQMEQAASAGLPMEEKTKSAGTTYGKKAMKAAEKSRIATDEAIKADAERVKKENEVETARLAQESRLLNEDAENAEIQAVFDAAEFGQLQEDVDKKRKEYDAAEIDSGKFWADMGTGNQVLMTMGMILGGIGQGITGKDNPALKILDNYIDRDIDIQKANIAKQGKALELSQGALNDFWSLNKNKKAAEANARAVKYNAVAKRAEEMMAQVKGNEGATARMADLVKHAREQEMKWLGEADRLEWATERATAKVGKRDTIEGTQTAKLAQQQASLKNAYEIRDFFSSVETGPIAGRLQNIEQKFGKESPEYAKFISQLKGAYQEYKLRITGTASSAKQDEELKQVYPQETDSPKNFLAKLDEIIKQQERAYDTELQTYTNQGRVHGMPLSSDLRKSSAGGWQQYFKDK